MFVEQISIKHISCARHCDNNAMLNNLDMDSDLTTHCQKCYMPKTQGVMGTGFWKELFEESI